MPTNGAAGAIAALSPPTPTHRVAATRGTMGIHPILSFRLDRRGHCAKGGGSEVLMHVTRSVRAKIRKWLGRLGLLGRDPVRPPYGAGAP
jgi:hypothetical protein